MTSLSPEDFHLDLSEIENIDLQIVEINYQIQELHRKKNDLTQLRARLVKEEEENKRKVFKVPEKLSESNFEWSPKLQEAALKHWGIKHFRENQLEIINAVMMKNDVFVIMPTGGGKSLCFQLPAILQTGLTVVVSPLISLIQDQVLCLQEMGIKAGLRINLSHTSYRLHYLKGMLTSHNTKEDIKATTDEITDILSENSKKPSKIISDALKLIYVTPEKIAKSKRFIALLEKLYKAKKLSSIVIDEAHCCSQLGHDFRPDYKKLGILKTLFSDCPLIALSATCPPDLQSSVISILNMRPLHTKSGTLLFQSSLFRPNLRYAVVQKQNSLVDQVKQMLDFINKKYKEKCGIIYCLSKKDCSNVSEEILKQSKGRKMKMSSLKPVVSVMLGKIKVGLYHADLSNAERKNIHVDWRSKKIHIVVATIAFGLGINQPDVRFVIHHTISKSVEGYYQESGRAGRDGFDSDCVLLYKGGDASKMSGMLVSEVDGLKGIYGMLRYCQDINTCRRILMERYFEDGTKINKNEFKLCNNCDYCSDMESGKKNHSINIIKEVSGVLKILKFSTGQGEKFTLNKLVEALFGLGKKIPFIEKMKRENQISIPTSCFFSKEDFERIIIHILLEGYIKEDFHFTAYQTYSYLVLTPKGSNLLSNSNPKNFMFDFKNALRGSNKVDKEVDPQNYWESDESSVEESKFATNLKYEENMDENKIIKKRKIVKQNNDNDIIFLDSD